MNVPCLRQLISLRKQVLYRRQVIVAGPPRVRTRFKVIVHSINQRTRAADQLGHSNQDNKNIWLLPRSARVKEERDAHKKWLAKQTTEGCLVCARWTNSPEYG